MHGLGFLVLIAIRLAVYYGGKRAAATGRPQPAWVASLQRSRRLRPSMMGWVVRGGLLLLAYLSLVNEQPLWLAFFLVAGLPQAVLGLLLIPAGVPYAAYYFTRVA